MVIAVIAVKKGNTIVWSWHLWFAPKDALDKIPVTNHQNVVYNFTKEVLGWKPTQWSGSIYDKPRTVKVKVEQTIANGGVKQETVINIMQKPGRVWRGATTFYQFGRKDAFPGVAKADLATNSHFTEDAGDNMSIMNGIQHPGNFYSGGNSWSNTPPTGYSYFNLWSADNTVFGFNDNSVIKTVYDPCPVGFKMPASNAFTGFTTHGQNDFDQSKFNIDGTLDWDQWIDNFGHNFWTNNSKTATINFPASGNRFYSNGSLRIVGSYGNYWTAVPNYILYSVSGCLFDFDNTSIHPRAFERFAYGSAVRPVSE